MDSSRLEVCGTPSVAQAQPTSPMSTYQSIEAGQEPPAAAEKGAAAKPWSTRSKILACLALGAATACLLVSGAVRATESWNQRVATPPRRGRRIVPGHGDGRAPDRPGARGATASRATDGPGSRRRRGEGDGSSRGRARAGSLICAQVTTQANLKITSSELPSDDTFCCKAGGCMSYTLAFDWSTKGEFECLAFPEAPCYEDVSPYGSTRIYHDKPFCCNKDALKPCWHGNPCPASGTGHPFVADCVENPSL